MLSFQILICWATQLSCFAWNFKSCRIREGIDLYLFLLMPIFSYDWEKQKKNLKSFQHMQKPFEIF